MAPGFEQRPQREDIKPSEVIDRFLEDLETGTAHWIQGEPRDGKGGYCLSGGIYHYIYQARFRVLVGSEALDAVARAIEAVEPDWMLNKFQSLSLCIQRSAVPLWNDTPGRTFDEVRTVLEKARADLQERGL